jgi:hypothetical protein
MSTTVCSNLSRCQLHGPMSGTTNLSDCGGSCQNAIAQLRAHVASNSNTRVDLCVALCARSVGGDSTRKPGGCEQSRVKSAATQPARKRGSRASARSVGGDSTHTSLEPARVRVQSAATQRAHELGTRTGARSVGGDSTRTPAWNTHGCAFSRRRLNAHTSLEPARVRVQSAATQRARKHVRVESAATQRARKRGTHTGARSIGGDFARTHDWCPCARLVVTALRKAHNASAQMRVQSLAADHVHAVCACAFARVQSP